VNLCFLATLLQIYSFILFIRIILSWVTMTAWTPPSGLAPIIGFIFDITEPVLRFARQFIPPLGPIDISPIIVFIVLGLVQGAIC
jgi:YggT family protein